MFDNKIFSPGFVAAFRRHFHPSSRPGVCIYFPTDCPLQEPGNGHGISSIPEFHPATACFEKVLGSPQMPCFLVVMLSWVSLVAVFLNPAPTAGNWDFRELLNSSNFSATYQVRSASNFFFASIASQVTFSPSPCASYISHLLFSFACLPSSSLIPFFFSAISCYANRRRR